MKCLHPIHLKNDAGYTTVPCGKCAACITRKRNEWGFRLKTEAQHSECTYFFTLTYSEENITWVDDVNESYTVPIKRDIQLFLKRFRKNLDNRSKLRYFIVSEYGTNTDRAHYHGLFFFDKFIDKHIFKYLLEKSWNVGFITFDPVNINRIFYVSDYIYDKTLNSQKLIKPFLLSSRKPGIGYQYLNEQNKKRHDKDLITYVNFGDGRKFALPEYYKRKILSPESRTELNIQNIIRQHKEEIEYQKKYGFYDKKLMEEVTNQYVKGELAYEEYLKQALIMKDQIEEEYMRRFFKKSKSNKL